jgi:hypothetical protein
MTASVIAPANVNCGIEGAGRVAAAARESVHKFPLDMAPATRGKKRTSCVHNFPLVRAAMTNGKKCTLARLPTPLSQCP